MDRWNGVAVRAYWPAAFALLVAVVSVAVLSRWQASPLLAGFVALGRWVPLLALASTLWLVAAPTYRLVQWQRGQGFDCRVAAARWGANASGTRAWASVTGAAMRAATTWTTGTMSNAA